ncbi:MAG: protein translocase subunit SecD [Candidatus Rokubacteria bacterium]|nr:protein translocase subunit SecD [Candidatus Rokubacteria bacterium]
MPRNLWLRIGLIAVAVAVSLWYLYPPKQRINLGLDLQGGIHLILGVDTKKAIAAQTERAAEDFRQALERKGIGIKRVAREGDRAISVALASPASWNDALTVASQFQTFTRKASDQTVGTFTLEMDEREASQQIDLATRGAVEKIRNRVDKFGVAEATITRQGDDRILIQLPGVQDPDRAKALIGQTGLLEFKLLDERTSVEEALAGRLPETAELLFQRRVDPESKQETKIPFVVQKRTLLTGAELTDASVQADPNSTGNWQVSITFSAAGAQRFGEITENSVGRYLAIVLDGSVYSAPRINERIPGGRAVITGQFTVEQARDLAIVLREGALPAAVSILEERTVGPSLGADSIRQGMIAIAASAALVFVFMLVYYRLSGLIADVALVLNLLLLLACMAAFGATLTLPGIAGIALTLGMAVDTNILIFERIREELNNGKLPRSAIEAGFNRAFRTIIDTHVTVLVTAAILYNFGTGPVKGFAVSLFVGLSASLFTAVFFTRLLFDLIYLGRRKVATISI